MEITTASSNSTSGAALSTVNQPITVACSAFDKNGTYGLHGDAGTNSMFVNSVTASGNGTADIFIQPPGTLVPGVVGC